MSMPVAFAGGASPQIQTDALDNNSRRSRAQKAVAAQMIAAAASPVLANRRGESILSRLNKAGFSFNKKLRYEIDRGSNEVTVKVIDGNTNKVIKILPPEELQRLRRSSSGVSGALFDEKA